MNEQHAASARRRMLGAPVWKIPPSQAPAAPPKPQEDQAPEEDAPST
jgi:hypothetical protein